MVTIYTKVFVGKVVTSYHNVLFLSQTYGTFTMVIIIFKNMYGTILTLRNIPVD